ncbi:hypothetical protein F4823DRAFT_574295 [Ustulina deusta]|nr:hypothetical protein F4823DRAFT_574295 [Ustulina deusta]
MAHEEETFRAYTQAQGHTYAAGRPGYSPELFKIIIAHHTSTSGQLNTVLDIGCGTGQATLDLAPYFANAIGLDPSEGMIGTARASAESANLPRGPCSPPPRQPTGSTWHAFWPSAARVLKPGGNYRRAFGREPGWLWYPVRTPNGAAIKSRGRRDIRH